MPTRTAHHATQSGLTLVELMVAITIGLLLMAGLTTIFVNSNQARAEIEKTNQQIENGRYAMQLLTDDLRLAGFYGELDPTALTAPTSKPDPCLTTAADLTAALPVHVEGYDNYSSSTGLSCLTSADDFKTGTDVLVVRHASTCLAGVDTDCDPLTVGLPYLQVSLCANETSPSFNLDTIQANLTRTQINCVTPANKRRYRTHIYFIANNDKPGDGKPTLKRKELDASGFGTTVPLVEGIQDMQLEYGIDTNCDGMPEVYNANPDNYVATYNGKCSGAMLNWLSVMSVKLNILSVNTGKTMGYTDTKQYALGLNADSSANTAGPFNDNFKRHVYQAVVRLANPIGRRQQ